ncbi:hypothetical protein VP01_934g5 [Puccinia sorghi]|uniref:Uncharacterized protein n=1 Tax=Puccinia sorghi TaxID=27349 RepID=A0A0L6U6X1_9BASI|nr:hypothetical protein VP01_934g5 [Puccinia sorghi]
MSGVNMYFGSLPEMPNPLMENLTQLVNAIVPRLGNPRVTAMKASHPGTLPQRPVALYLEKVEGNMGWSGGLQTVPKTSYIMCFNLGQVRIHKWFNQPKPLEGLSADQTFSEACIEQELICVRAVAQFLIN